MNDIPKYKISIDDIYSDGKDLGIDLISYTATPAIKIKGHAFNSQEIPKYSTFKDGKKYRIAGPAIIPGDIYRNDEDGEYFVEFTEKEIEKMVLKFMKRLGSSKNKIFNVEHTDEMAPAYILEAWLVTDPERDKSFSEYGIKVPKGTFFVVSQFTDKEYYELIVSQDKVGYSIEGFLGLSLSELEQINNNKNETKMKKEELMLPEGAKFQIEDKWYEVKDGKVVEVVEAEKEVAATEVSVKEEVEMSEEVKEEVKEENLEEVIDIEYQPKFDEIYEMIAALKAEIGELKGELKVEEEMLQDDKLELSAKLNKFYTHFKK